MIAGQDESALARWALAPPAPSVHTDVLAVLIAIGDALRRGAEIPKPLRVWMKGLAQADAEIALGAIALDKELSSECRDELDAARRAVLRIAMSNGWSLTAMTSMDRLGHAVERFDVSNASTTSRATRGAILDDVVVLAYARRGELAQYVEDVAQQDPAFGEELATCIDALAEADPRAGIADAARRWRANWSPPKKEPIDEQKRGIREPVKVVDIAARRVRRVRQRVSAAFAAMVLLAMGGGYHLKRAEERALAVQAMQKQELAEQEARLAELQKQALAYIETEMANAKTATERAEATAGLKAVQGAQNRTKSGIPSARAAGANPSSSSRHACTCPVGDPMCSCF
ncbi:MAG: hypothetical protein FWD73_06470 [Polyangiaceae bacterium]|nr:hypothetical protein [Polyangiaceae bacterium]